MRIAIDVSPLSRPRTGVGSYLRGMVAGILEAGGSEHDVVAFALASGRGRRAIRDALDGFELERRLCRVPYPYAWRRLWSASGRLPVETFVGRVDVLHFSDWTYPPQRAGVRATTICDLVPLRFPEWTTPRTRALVGAKLTHTARTCDVVFTISLATREDVIERLGVSAERVAVAYPGVDPRFHADGDRETRARPFVLAVATREPRKNLAVLVRALELVRGDHPDVSLVVAGPPGWGEEGTLDRPWVETLGYVDADRLARLYRGAAALAYPSLFEGFGMPVVEAMACGLPTVVSSHPTLDEACGNAALRADPTSPEELARAIGEALAAPELLRERGLEHARGFTWEACGRAVLAGYAAASERSRLSW